jgi:RNA polymerase sigma-70 factor (ECF subfamily)
LHRALLRVAPSLGAAVALAVIDGEVDGPEAGLQALDATESAERFQPAWTARAHLLALAGQPQAAALAYRRAIDLTADPGVGGYLERRMAALTDRA